MNVEKNKRPALTLIEVIIVIGMISILLAIGYFSLSKNLRKERVKSAAFELRSDIFYERQQAFAQGRSRGVTRDSTDDSRYLTVKLDSFPAFFTVIKAIEFPSGVRFGNPWGTSDINGGGIDGTTLPGDGITAENLVSGAPPEADNLIIFDANGTLLWAETYYVYITSGEVLYGLKINKWGGIGVYVYRSGGWKEIE